MRLKLKFDDFYESGRKIGEQDGFQKGERAGFQRGKQAGSKEAEQEIALTKAVFRKHIAGCSNEDIANQLSINLKTIQNILAN